MERNLWLDSDTARTLRLPVFVTSLLWAANTFPPVFYNYSVVLCLFVSLALGGLSVLLFAPTFEAYLGWWRSAFGSHGFWVSILLLNLLLVAWNFSLTSFLWGFLEFATGASWPGFISLLDTSSSQLSTLKMVLFLAFGLIACVGSRLLFGKELIFESTGKGLWCLGGLLLCYWLLTGCFLARLGWLGWTVDEDLRELAERDSVHSFLEFLHYGRVHRDYLSKLPAEFSEYPGIAEAIPSSDNETRLQTLPVWLEVVHQRMSRKEYWHDEELQNLALLGEMLYRIGDIGAEALEVRLAAALVLLERDYFWIDITLERLTEYEAEVNFPKLVELILTRPDLHLAPALDIPTVSHTFTQRYYKLHPRRHSSHKPLQFFAALEARKQLNLEWRQFKGGLPYPSQPPLSRQELARDDGLRPLLLEQQTNRASMVALLLYLELKGLSRNGRALPQRWEEFSPKIEQIGRAYDDWILVEFEEDGVRVSLYFIKRTNPLVLWVPRD